MLIISVTLISGCSGKVSVTGTVKYTDGEPLAKGSVYFRNEEGTRMFRGALQPDGTFELGEMMDGDGIPAGRYSAWIAGANTSDYVRTADGDLTDQQTHEILIDPKFESPETSGLTYEVTGATKFDIVVERPAETESSKINKPTEH
jgi:hypothetical protein